MAIKKQEFYEGAAIHILARSGGITGIKYESPLFLVNDHLLVLLQYSTRGRSPWGFTFMPDEQMLLYKRGAESKIIIGLICGADGVAAFTYDAYLKIADLRDSAIHLACYRKHHEHYEVSGPNGTFERKVSPSNWQRILQR